MGRKPPFFCAATKTARDVFNDYIKSDEPLPVHPMEDIMMDIDWKRVPTHASNPVQT